MQITKETVWYVLYQGNHYVRRSSTDWTLNCHTWHNEISLSKQKELEKEFQAQQKTRV